MTRNGPLSDYLGYENRVLGHHLSDFGIELQYYRT